VGVHAVSFHKDSVSAECSPAHRSRRSRFQPARFVLAGRQAFSPLRDEGFGAESVRT
jgi:hypothetical protein